MWAKVPESGSSIVNYTVRYHSAIHEDAQNEISTKKLSANLTRLTMNTNYTITVEAFNQKGHGPPSDPIFVTTSNGSKVLALKLNCM